MLCEVKVKMATGGIQAKNNEAPSKKIFLVLKQRKITRGFVKGPNPFCKRSFFKDSRFLKPTAALKNATLQAENRLNIPLLKLVNLAIHFAK